MDSLEIEEFARVLIKEVRDRTIVNCDSQLKESSNSPNAKRWRELNVKHNTDLVKAVIADCVDLAIANFLSAIDHGSLNLKFVSSDNHEVDLTKANDELTGWYMGSGEWREKFSKERYFDDFKDL
jgi:hypothetical protein